MGEGHSSVSEVPSDVGVYARVRFRVDGEGGGESSSVELATEREVDGVFFVVGGGGMGVPSHMALRVIATALCLFHCLSLGFVSSSSS